MSKDIEVLIKAQDGATPALNSVGKAAKGTQEQINSLSQSANGLGSIFRNAAGFAAGIAGFQGITAAINGTIGAIGNFARTMEVNETGIAGILMSMTELNGRTMTWGESIKLSKNIMAQLNSEAMRTAATTEELTNAFRGILGPGLNAGMTIDQLIKLTSAGANAVKSIMPGNAAAQVQIVQELRDLVAGGIQPASSTLATALGLRDSDIKKAKASAEGLYNFLMDRLKGFETSAPYYAKTFSGIWEQIKEGFTLAGSQGTSGIFNALKQELNDISGQIVKFNEETNKMEVNPELVATFESISTVIIDAARGLGNFAETAGKVVTPAVGILGDVIKIAAKNAELLAYAGTTWYVLGKISAATTIVQNFWSTAVAQTTARYAEQAVASEVAGTVSSTAAVKAAASQQVLTAAVGETAAAQLASGAAASAASVKTVSSMAVARTASVNFLSGLKMLAGGWIGIAVATGYAIKALYDYFDAKGKVESYDPKAEVYEENGKLYKKQWFENNTLTDEEIKNQDFSNLGSGYKKVELSEGEYAEHNKWKAWKTEMDSKKPWDIDPNNDLLSKITSKFNTSGDTTGTKTQKQIDKISDKIGNAFDSLNQKILTETGTTYELGMAKISDELAKIQREVVDDGNNLGLDTSALTAKMNEYAAAMTEPIRRAWREAWTDLKNQSALGLARLTGDKKAEAAANEAISLASLDKERREKLKAVQTNSKDTQAAAAVEVWYENQKLIIVQKRLDDERTAKINAYNDEVEMNGWLVTLHAKTQDEVDKLNRDVLDKKIAYLREELNKEGLTADEIKRIRKELADATSAKESTPLTRDEGITKGLQDSYKSFGTEGQNWVEAAKTAATGMQSAFQNFFFDAMTGQLESLGDYFSSFLKSIASAMSQLFANMAAKAMLKWLFPGMTFATGGRAPSGSTFLAGERGPELISLDGSGASITSSQATTSKLGGSGNVTVNVINQTGQEVKATQSQPTFDEFGNIILDVFLSAVATNKRGVRDVMAGAVTR